jgi:hypothetical protein
MIYRIVALFLALTVYQDEDVIIIKLLGVYSSISISSCRLRHILNGCCRTLQMFSILEYHAKSSFFNEFVCKLDFFWHDWASLKCE